MSKSARLKAYRPQRKVPTVRMNSPNYVPMPVNAESPRPEELRWHRRVRRVARRILDDDIPIRALRYEFDVLNESCPPTPPRPDIVTPRR